MISSARPPGSRVRQDLVAHAGDAPAGILGARVRDLQAYDLSILCHDHVPLLGPSQPEARMPRQRGFAPWRGRVRMAIPALRPESVDQRGAESFVAPDLRASARDPIIRTRGRRASGRAYGAAVRLPRASARRRDLRGSGSSGAGRRGSGSTGAEGSRPWIAARQCAASGHRYGRMRCP